MYAVYKKLISNMKTQGKEKGQNDTGSAHTDREKAAMPASTADEDLRAKNITRGKEGHCIQQRVASPEDITVVNVHTSKRGLGGLCHQQGQSDQVLYAEWLKVVERIDTEDDAVGAQKRMRPLSWGNPRMYFLKRRFLEQLCGTQPCSKGYFIA